MTFRVPLPDDAAAPAAAAIASPAPPESVLNYDILTDSNGVRHDQKGHPGGWSAIVRKYELDVNCAAKTGFEDDMSSVVATIPYDWECARALWWNPAAVTPSDCFWKEVTIDDPALGFGVLRGQLPSYKMILSRWFRSNGELFHKVCTGVIGVLRHTGGFGRKRGHRVLTKAIPMSTFGWCNLHHLAQVLKKSHKAYELDAAGLIMSIKHETSTRDDPTKQRYRFMILMQSPTPTPEGTTTAPRGSAEFGAPTTRVATAFRMKEEYFVPRARIFDVPP